jgi:hypothetical protein
VKKREKDRSKFQNIFLYIRLINKFNKTQWLV